MTAVRPRAREGFVAPFDGADREREVVDIASTRKQLARATNCKLRNPPTKPTQPDKLGKQRSRSLTNLLIMVSDFLKPVRERCR